MKRYTVVLAAALVGGCGGGNSTGDAPQPAPSFPAYTQEERVFVGGGGVFVGEDVVSLDGQSSFNEIVITYDDLSADGVVATMQDFNEDKSAYEVAPFGPAGLPFFANSISGKTAADEALEVLSYGANLPSGGTIGMSEVRIDGVLALTAGGETFTGQAPAQAMYVGDVLISGGEAGNIELGGFQMDADFAAGRASLSASSATKSLTADALPIADTTARFSGNGTLSDTAGPVPAAITGFFAGAGAEGVTGSATETGPRADPLDAVFYGLVQ